MKLNKIELSEKECIVILNALAGYSLSLRKRGTTRAGNVKPKFRKDYETSGKLERFFSDLVSRG